MRRDADSLRVKCHFNSSLPFMESICRRDFSAQKVRRQREVSERWKAVYFEHIFISLLSSCTDDRYTRRNMQNRRGEIKV